MNQRKYSSKDWNLPNLCLCNVNEQPRSKDVVTVACSVCGSEKQIIFAELIRTINRQIVYVDLYHCINCLRSTQAYKTHLSNKSKQSAALVPKHIRSERSRIALGAVSHELKSLRSKKNWEDPEYRKKLSRPMADETKRRLSVAMKNKFENDQCYVARINEARRKPGYRKVKTLSLEEFITRAKLVHGDKYDYSLVRIDNPARQIKVKIRCHEHGIFEQRPLWHIIYANGCPRCNTIISKPHQEIINFIKSIYDGELIINTKQFIKFELDIVLPDLGFAIEFNGNWYHSHDNTNHLSKYLHYIKASKARRSKIKLLQIFEYDWMISKKRSIILSMISNTIGISSRVFARRCIIKKLSTSEQHKFFDNNHLYGKKPATVAYGLYLNDEVVCAMSFQDHKSHWEVVRLATKIGLVVIGGASKLFKHFISLHNPELIRSYADRAISNGTVYYNLGFTCEGITKPGYKYFKNNKIYSRIKFQKHKLSSILPHFDNSRTELQNMFDNGYRAIWDAGHLKFSWKPVKP